jgi:hypothetical protein
MASKSQIATIAKRIEALAATRGATRFVIVAGDETVEEALHRSGGGSRDGVIFISTGVPRGYGERM